MSPFWKQLAFYAPLGVCLLLGCAPWKLPSGPAGRSDAATSPAESEVSAADRAVLARGVDQQRRSVWIRAVDGTQPGATGPKYRWRYPNLEDLLARPPRHRPNFRAVLAGGERIAAANAAIALSRLGDPTGAEQLAAAVRGAETKMPMRRAACEALAHLEGPAIVQLLSELIDQYGRQYGRHSVHGNSSYLAELHAELIRGLARHVDPAGDRRFLDALRSRSPQVRLEAVRAWSAGRRGSLPQEAVELLSDGDYRVRCAVLEALVRRRHADAGKHLIAALDDIDLQVRVSAIQALGQLAGPDAQAALEGLLQNQPEKIRAEATAALAQIGARQAVLNAAADKSWRVRLEVARAMAEYPPRDAASTARALVHDPSARVQGEMVRSLAAWPLSAAGPLLLQAMGKASYATRQAAAEQLTDLWQPAGEFPVGGLTQRREAALALLKQRFGEQFGVVDETPAEPRVESPPDEPVTPRQLARVEQLVRQKDFRALAAFGPGVVEALERLAIDRRQVLPEEIYRDVLPRCDAVFAELDQLTSSDVLQRRRAAAKVAELAGQRPLGHLALTRLGQLVTAEPDQLVWRSALLAVAGRSSEPAVQLAYAALSHPSAEVRRRGCEHLRAHPDPRHATLLVRSLEDRSEPVVCAAVHALAAGGRIDDTAPLHRLLQRGHENVRAETAIALRSLGDPTATAELERLAYSSNWEIRHRVAGALGQRTDPAAVATLIRMLDDRRTSIRLAALASLPQAAGHDAANAAGAAPIHVAQRIEHWKQWYRRR